jgi:3-methylcrotonyl-CoA carboxylase alpha subunit
MSEKTVTISGAATEVALERDGTTYRSGEHELDVLALRAEEIEIRVDGRTSVVPYVIQGTTVSFAYEGEIYVADVAEKGSRSRAHHRESSTAAPMPGLVTKILVRQGDVVAKGAPLLIVEAMKMEHQITTPKDGTVTAVNCREGEMVQPGVELVTIEDR